MTRTKIVKKAVLSLLGGAALAVLVALVAPASPAAAATVGIDLYAVTGTTTLGTQAVTVWGYTSTGAAATQPGGPTLTVDQGDTVNVTLHNGLSEDTGLLFQGQAMVPDRSGAPGGGTKTYSFTASRPGTYLYEAALLPNAQHQVAMGLYGALIVRPAVATQAYDDPATAFNTEAVELLSEIDPALNNRTTGGGPAGFDMRKYAPRYFLINGKVHPNTAPIPATAGNEVLVRYVNAGIQYHSMAVLGTHQTVIALDGSPLTHSRRYVAETFGPGQTADAIITAPAATPAVNRLPIYDGSLLLHNTNAAGAGGMLTFLTVAAGAAGPDTTGPVTSGVGYSAGNLSATVDDATTGGANVSAAEYFVDTVGAPGSGTAMTGSFGSVSANVSAAAAVVSGQHILYVRGQDSAGNWGVLSSVLVTAGDVVGPATTGPAVTPNVSNGTVGVAVHATGNDSASGGSNIAAGEFFVDAAGPDGSGTAMTVNAAAPIASLDGTITAAAVNALAPGAHLVYVHSQDSAGNWGAPVSVTLTVDKAGPATSGVSAVPNPNNGTLPYSSGNLSVRVSATATDDVAVAGAEGFIDTVGANGTGFVFAANDGTFNSATEAGHSDVPLATIAQLTTDYHTIYVHAKDSAGNWGATATTVLLIDKVAPTFTGISLAPNPTYGATSVTLTVNGAVDNGGVGLAGGEYWINPPTTSTPVPGSGTQFSGTTANIPVGTLATGTYTVSVRLRDAVYNWSAGTNGVRSATLTVVPDPIFANGFETGTRPWGWSSASTTTATRLNVSTAAALVGTLGLQAQGNNTNYVQYNFGTAANPASPTFDARFSFNPNGNTGVNQDIFVARTTGAATVFRVRYRWNGGAPQVQIQVGTGTANTAWTGITNGASNRIEVVWQSGGTLQLFVGGSLVANQTLTATTTSVGQFRLGSVTSGGSATLEYFDAFSAKRTVTPYGP